MISEFKAFARAQCKIANNIREDHIRKSFSVSSFKQSEINCFKMSFARISGHLDDSMYQEYLVDQEQSELFTPYVGDFRDVNKAKRQRLKDKENSELYQ